MQNAGGVSEYLGVSIELRIMSECRQDHVMLHRLRILVCLGALLCVHGVTAQFKFPPMPSKPVPPNVIWIIANDLGCGDLGCYGQKKIRTRNIDRLAREGMMFTQCYASSPDNQISRASLLTGRDERFLDLLPDSPVMIEPGVTTIGQVMQQAGYRNAYIGKWLLGKPNSYSQPQRKGFNDWIGELEPQTITDFYPDWLWRFDPDNKTDGKQTWSYNLVGRQGVYLNEFFLRSMTNYVRIHYPNRWNRFTPFFQVVSFALPNPLDEWQGNTNRFSAVPNAGAYTTRDWPMAERQKAAAIAKLDNYLGQLFKVLEKHQQVTNTVIFLTSDGGAFERGGCKTEFFDSTAGLRGKRGDLTEGGIRVPLLVRWTGTIKGRTTNHLLCSLMDLMPTTIDIARGKKPEPMNGISLLPSLYGGKQTNRHDFLIWSRTNRYAVRKGDWKAMQNTNATWELFNLKEDRAEGTNVVAQAPHILKSITNDLARWLK